MTSNLTTPDLELLDKYVDETPTAVNIAIPIISIVFFFASVVITYFIDDPGIKTLKNASTEDNLEPISESDRNHLRYLAERKLYIDMKGHTFSAFTPSRTITESDAHAGHSTGVDGGRRRACSESHAPSFPETNSETQIILQHMLIRAGYAHNNTDSLFSGNSGRSRSGFSNPFSSLKKPKSANVETQEC
ncbi:unnamed protein product [Schistosoma margrebowiei]|uniref:Transmembrane protein n=1 Tax=Schistosoma margrebowiei TaxID=48269 RepID=A0AA85A6B5_9TREM|nr:unnamed protein product [Schistosoma margrebowiei]